MILGAPTVLLTVGWNSPCRCGVFRRCRGRKSLLSQYIGFLRSHSARVRSSKAVVCGYTGHGTYRVDGMLRHPPCECLHLYSHEFLFAYSLVYIQSGLPSLPSFDPNLPKDSIDRYCLSNLTRSDPSPWPRFVSWSKPLRCTSASSPSPHSTVPRNTIKTFSSRVGPKLQKRIFDAATGQQYYRPC